MPPRTAIGHEPVAYHTPESLRHEYRDEPELLPLRFSRLLDFPTEPTERIDRWFAHWLGRLSMVADGGVTQMAERVSGPPTAKSKAPRSALAADLSRYEWQYDACRTHRERLKLILAIQTETLRLQIAPKRAQVGSDDWRRDVAEDERANAVVCAVYGVSPSTLKRYRREFGIRRATGRPKRVQSLPNRQMVRRFQRGESVRPRIVVTFAVGTDVASLGFIMRPVIGPDIDSAARMLGAFLAKQLPSFGVTTTTPKAQSAGLVNR